MSEPDEIRFHSDKIFAGDTGVIDEQNAVVHGVSLITGNLVAEGHNLHVDQETLRQLQTCAKERGKIPVGLDHSAGIASTCGFITGFRIDGDKLRGDLHLLKSHEETPRILERAREMPTCFGLSVAFKGPPKGVAIGGGKMAARCEKLLSVDLVQRPAANDGLFSSKVDMKNKGHMANDAQGNAAEPTLAQILEAVQGLTARVDQQDEFLNSLTPQQESQESQEPTLEDFHNATDEELAAFNKAYGTDITRQDINAAVAEVMAQQEGGEEEGGKEGGEGEGTGEPEPASAGVDYSPSGAASAGGASGGAEMSALKREVIELKRKDQARELKAKTDAENIELAEIERKAITLAQQRDEAINLAEQYQAENQALRLAVKTGTRPVKAGIDNGIRLFSANGEGTLHEFQIRVKQIQETGKSEGEAIRFAQKENPALHADWVQSLRTKVA